MHEIRFHEGYYGTTYNEENPQVKICGVHYDRGNLNFQFNDIKSITYNKQTRDPLEMLVLSEILYGSNLWTYKASVGNYNGYNSIKKTVALLVTVDDSYINTYKDTSVGFKVYMSTLFNNLKSYGGREQYPKLRENSYLPYCEPIEQPKKFKVDLFEYQKKSIAKMLAIEKKELDLMQ